jgi:hypothetical protein
MFDWEIDPGILRGECWKSLSASLVTNAKRLGAIGRISVITFHMFDPLTAEISITDN